MWLHPPCGNYDHDEKKFFEVLDICGRWQVRHFGSLFVPVPLDDADQERRVRLQMESFGQVHKVLIDETAFFKATHNTAHEAYVAEGEVDEGGRAEVERLQEGAAGINFDKKVPSDMAAALRRLHQNLGHPAREDLVRHLHHAGADRDVIKAAKSLECSTCARMKGPKSARPAAEPKLLEFGDVVGVDMMYAYDVDGKKIKLFSMVDHASSYQVVVQVTRQTGSILEKTFLKNWVQVFGAPKVITLDLEREYKMLSDDSPTGTTSSSEQVLDRRIGNQDSPNGMASGGKRFLPEWYKNKLFAEMRLKKRLVRLLLPRTIYVDVAVGLHARSSSGRIQGTKQTCNSRWRKVVVNFYVQLMTPNDAVKQSGMQQGSPSTRSAQKTR